MKYQVVINTTLGVYKAQPTEMNEEQVGHLVSYFSRVLDYVNLEDVNGSRVIVQKEALANSVIVIEKLP